MVHPQDPIFRERPPVALQLELSSSPWSGNVSRSVLTSNEVEYDVSSNGYLFHQGFCLTVSSGEVPAHHMKVHVVSQRGTERMFTLSYDLDMDALAVTPSTMWGSVTQSNPRGEVSSAGGQLSDINKGPRYKHSDLVLRTFRPCSVSLCSLRSIRSIIIMFSMSTDIASKPVGPQSTVETCITLRFAEFTQSEDVFSKLKVMVKVVPDSDDSRSVQSTVIQNKFSIMIR